MPITFVPWRWLDYKTWLFIMKTRNSRKYGLINVTKPGVGPGQVIGSTKSLGADASKGLVFRIHKEWFYTQRFCRRLIFVPWFSYNSHFVVRFFLEHFQKSGPPILNSKKKECHCNHGSLAYWVPVAKKNTYALCSIR